MGYTHSHRDRQNSAAKGDTVEFIENEAAATESTEYHNNGRVFLSSELGTKAGASPGWYCLWLKCARVLKECRPNPLVRLPFPNDMF